MVIVEEDPVAEVVSSSIFGFVAFLDFLDGAGGGFGGFRLSDAPI
jgi:hypothetical protein